MDAAGDFDLAIVGAGVSGLVLALLLDQAPLDHLRVLLIDGARDDDELRTLSFWSAGPTPLDALVRHEWHTLRLHLDGAVHDVRLREQVYRTLFFADLQRDVKARLSARAGSLVVEGRVGTPVPDGDGVLLPVGPRTFRARWVADSRFHLRDLVVDRGRYHLLRQHFHGWIVRAPADVFEPSTATLLDVRVGVPPGTGFAYVLPFDPRQALVELVTLHPVDAEPLLRDHLRRAYGLTDVEILDRESGISPMTEQPFDPDGGPRVRRIGVAAGRLKASTGYALTRILDDSAAVVACLQRRGHPRAPVRRARAARWLDGVLLEVWERDPARIPPVFAALFRRNPPDRVLRFLDERASPPEVARLVLTLPKGPFVRAAVRWTARRLRARTTRGRARRPGGERHRPAP